ERAGEAGAGGHRGPVAAADRARRRCCVGGAVAELAVVVVAPAPQRAVGGDAAGVPGAGADGDPIAARTDGDGMELRRRGRADAELAGLVVAPAAQATVAGDAARVQGAGGERAPRAGDRRRAVGAGGGAVAELAGVARAPAPQAGVGAEAAAMAGADGQRGPRGGAAGDGGGIGRAVAPAEERAGAVERAARGHADAEAAPVAAGQRRRRGVIVEAAVAELPVEVGAPAPGGVGLID